MHSWPAVPLVLLLLAVSVAPIASCSPSRDAALVVARDSAGIEIVESSQGASAKAPPRLSLSVEPTLQIGVERVRRPLFIASSELRDLPTVG